MYEIPKSLDKSICRIYNHNLRIIER